MRLRNKNKVNLNNNNNSINNNNNEEEINEIELEEMIKFNNLNELENELKKDIIKIKINKLRNGFSLLHIAAQVGNNLAIEMLLGNGANINILSKDNKQTPLDLSYHSNQQKTSIYLLEKGAEFTASVSTTERYYSGDVYTTVKDTARTLLHWSAKLGSIAAIDAVLRSNAAVDINVQNDNGSTALHQACAFGQEEAISYLIRHGASLLYRDYKGNAPFDKLKGGKDGLFAQKIRKLHLPLHEAIKLSNYNEIQELLEKFYATENKQARHTFDEDGYTPFQRALILNNIPVCHLFLFGTIDKIPLFNLTEQ